MNLNKSWHTEGQVVHVVIYLEMSSDQISTIFPGWPGKAGTMSAYDHESLSAAGVYIGPNMEVYIQISLLGHTAPTHKPSLLPSPSLSELVHMSIDHALLGQMSINFCK